MMAFCHAVTVNEPMLPEPGAAVPDPALVVLVGPAGSGKSAWAAARYRPQEVVSSDQLRAVVGSGEHDLDASADAFTLLDQIVAARVRRGLTTVIDTLGLDPPRRRGYAELARRHGLASVAVVFDTDPAECRRRNRARDRAVPAAVLDGQLRRMRAAVAGIPAEGWDLVLRAGSADPARPADPADLADPGLSVHLEPSHTPGARSAAREQQRRPVGLGFVLQLSRFGWDGYPGGPGGWLASVARNAAEAGLQGIALMDHLIQIPQVGRAWEPIPEPWVTLGMLAGLQLGLRLGTLVTPVTFRAPGILAKTVATLDALSGGRAFCGIGAGWWAREHAAFGLPFPPAPDRLDRLEATIETLRALWQPGTKAYQGERVSLPETTCYPRPASPIPVIVGGSGEQRTLRIAARLGDGCNLPSDPGELDRKLAVLREHCVRAGRDPAEVEITVLDVPVIGRDREHAASLVEQLRGRTTAAAFARRHHAGTSADHIGRYRLLAERGVTTVFVSLPDLAHPDDVLRLAPVTAAFA
jgi:alkanesulfonate monooxygenase SsuD/methylene tetrahydromethanopterin reductase-like flavin-dependent oxidoreductase (luciferase family)/predicted kinase